MNTNILFPKINLLTNVLFPAKIINAELKVGTKAQ